MEKLTRLTTEQRENLVAYLDGELEESQTRQIETVLSGSTVARNDVELLAKTYDLLELLPRPKASGEFTEKTLAVAKLGEVRTDFRRSPWYRRTQRGMRWLAWTALLVVISCTGYSVSRYRIPQEDDLLLDDLEIVRRLDDYEEAGSYQFLHRLSLEDQLLDKMNVETDRATQ